MTRGFGLTIAATLVVASAHVTYAQDMYTNAIRKAHNAASAADAHIEAEQKTGDQASGTRGAAAKTQAPASQTSNPRKLKLDLASVDTASPPPAIMRELFEYPLDGRRDPFVSLLTTSELRPAMSDLRLTGILYDQSGTRSVATLRDLGTNAQYRVTTGSVLGRMRVSAIRVKTIVFTIEEFGTARQDSLVLGDSTKTRIR